MYLKHIDNKLWEKEHGIDKIIWVGSAVGNYSALQFQKKINCTYELTFINVNFFVLVLVF